MQELGLLALAVEIKPPSQPLQNTVKASLTPTVTWGDGFSEAERVASAWRAPSAAA